MEVKGDEGTEDILGQTATPSQKENDPKSVEDHGLFHGKTLKDLVMQRLGGKKPWRYTSEKLQKIHYQAEIKMYLHFKR